MDRRSMVGWAVLVAGLLVTASVVASMSLSLGEVEARGLVDTTVDAPVVGPFHLDGGAYTIWLEDHPDLPGDTWRMLVYLIGNASDPVDYLVEERRVRDIEGTRCFQVGDFDMVAEGDWFVELVSVDIYNVTPPSLDLFIVSTFGMRTVAVLVLGILMLTLGVVLVVIGRMPRGLGR